MTLTIWSKWMSEIEELGHAALRRVPRGVVALTPGTLEPSSARGVYAALESMERAAAAAIEGGVRAIMVREPSLRDGAFLELAQRIRGRLDAAVPASSGNAWLAVHDRLHLAEAAGADAVHLGGTSLSLDAARSVVGTSLAIGVSSHGEDGADYAAADFTCTLRPLRRPPNLSTVGRCLVGRGWRALRTPCGGLCSPLGASQRCGSRTSRLP